MPLQELAGVVEVSVVNHILAAGVVVEVLAKVPLAVVVAKVVEDGLDTVVHLVQVQVQAQVQGTHIYQYPYFFTVVMGAAVHHFSR
jgi:hypothetical protein